ncbi:MAG: multiple sugar transport system substrate-binding protein [Patescibacteria group bacterium]|nr:multiple sugar transport system substrate-binding protein [Patescibacteria group bacterium]
MSKFQIILTSVFVLFIIIGVVLFATYKGDGGQAELPPITVWGTFPEPLLTKYITNLNITRPSPLKIEYTQISEANFDKAFIEALARGLGPDAILVSQDLLHKHEDKVVPIPYSVLSQRDFQNTFVTQAELYLHSSGVLALPFMLDPLVMYWNRDTFTNAGVAVFPKFWDEFSAIGQRINQKDVNSNIRKTVISLGEFNNLAHAREILGALFLQAGNPVTYRESDSLVMASAIGSRGYVGLTSSLPALNFFTKFSDPRNADYSWNRALPNSKSFFLSGNLATYIGFASELVDIRQKNPNIDFDVAPLPQARGGQNRATFGTMYGFSIVRSSADANSAFAVLSELLTPSSLSEMVTMSYLPPVRRDMIASGSSDPYLSIFYDSALISKGWLDTNKSESYRIFKDIVESVTSGKKNASQALQDGSDEFDLSLKNI